MITAATSATVGFSSDLDNNQDDLLARAATDVLRSSGYGLLKKLRCKVIDGVATITGAVPSFFLKQMAQEAVLRLGEVRHINNAVEVRRAEFAQPVESDWEPQRELLFSAK